MDISLVRPLISHGPAAIIGRGYALDIVPAGAVADVVDNGNFTLAGTVGIDATPDILGAYRVSLICKRSKRLVRQGWSNSSGQYRFDYIRPGPWIVLAEDHTGTYNAVVADNELAVAM